MTSRAGRVAATLLGVPLGGLAVALLGIGSAAAAAQESSAEALTGPVLVVGAPGLRWQDVSQQATPTLWRLADDGAIATMSVRTVRPRACPVDGWLTLGAGRRATAERPAAGDDGACPALSVSGTGTNATVAGMAAVTAYNRQFGYDPMFGLLGNGQREAGGCSTAVGPGAAIALAGADGRVLADYIPGSATTTATTLARCPLTVVDLAALPEDADPAVRARAVRGLDARLGRLLPLVRSDTTVIVAGLADDSATPHLHVTVATGPAPDGAAYGDGGWLTTRSTRRDGMVQLTDLTPTVQERLGEDDSSAVGAPMTTAAGRPADTSDAIRLLVEEDTRAQVVRDVGGAFFAVVGAVQLAAYALLLVLRRPAAGRVLRPVAVLFGAIPVATFLANLLPWARAGHPLPVLLIAVAAGTCVVTAAALLGPWRRRVLGPSTVVSAVTAGVLALDVVLGSRLQMSSLMGHSPLVAGRFYGFGNVAFAVFGTAAVLLAAGAADRPVATGRRRQAAGVVAVLGAVAVVVDGWPAFGSDFGGVLALVPAFALLTLLVLGARLSVVRLLGVAVLSVLTVTAVAVLDWLRPADSRSHLGDFVQTVLDGDGWDVVRRKAETNLDSLTSGPLAVVVPLVFALLLAAILTPARMRVPRLCRAYDEAPALRSGLVAAWVVAVLGFATNDSGVQVPAVALTIGVPLALAAYAGTRPERS